MLLEQDVENKQCKTTAKRYYTIALRIEKIGDLESLVASNVTVRCIEAAMLEPTSFYKSKADTTQVRDIVISCEAHQIPMSVLFSTTFACNVDQTG